MVRLLFICGRNRLRSPTAERIFGDLPGIECASAGVSRDAENPLTPDLIEWADIIFVMERRQQEKVSRQFGNHLRGKKLVCLRIADRYEYMQPELIALLWGRVPKSAPALVAFQKR